MLENLILILIIAIAALYAIRNFIRVLSGRSEGCGCSCDSDPPPQQTIPDLTDRKENPEDDKTT